jgi:hypothetical protein
MPAPPTDLFLTLWEKYAPMPFAWPPTEQFDLWFSMAIPAVFTRLKTLELENQQRHEDIQQVQRERDLIKAEVEHLRPLALSYSHMW